MTGMRLNDAASSTSDACAARNMRTLPYLMTACISSLKSVSENCVVFLSRKMACPPSSVIPASNESRVRVDDFSNNMMSVLLSR
ncbi:MAG: hypothetical protein ACD_48C00358G0001 [uncultured bacterium]|nr:MAG: hypothetical protein ACD_48C00358G0001 [uncultured bacterium]